MGKINTVLNEIDSSQLGFTLMHEHCYLGSWNHRHAFKDWFDYQAGLDMIVGVLKDAKEHGVNSIVDVTTLNMGRDIHLLEDASKLSGINIIAASGYMYDEHDRLSSEGIVDAILSEVYNGIEDTNIKPGVLKTGTSEFGFTKSNLKILNAVAEAAQKCGLPIITHCRPANTRQGLFQLDIFEQHGIDLSKVVIGHYRNGDSLAYGREVMDRGSNLAIDQMNFNDHQLAHNLEVIPQLVKEGYADRLILSHDAVIVYNYEKWNRWDHEQYINYSENSLSHISRNIIPALKERGVSDQDIHQMMYDNPQRILSR